MLKIAHISDLHLWKISYHFSQFFSKRWLGNLNLLIYRRKKFGSKQLWCLLKLFEELQVDLIIVSGDLSSTSLKSEFEAGKNLLDDFSKNLGIKSFVVPGNHDAYTKKAHREKLFYQYFQNEKGTTELEKSYSLKEDGVEAVFLKKQVLWCVGLDCSLATSLFSSRGLFSQKIEKNLKELLEKIPKEEMIILVNHYPFTYSKSPRKALKRASHLRNLIKKHPNIKLFLHGHTHHHRIYDLRAKELPLVLDSGSVAHNAVGKWNLLEIDKTSCKISIYDWLKKRQLWEKTEEKKYIKL